MHLKELENALIQDIADTSVISEQTMSQLMREPVKNQTSTGYSNHFLIGADPELILVMGREDEQAREIHASHLGLSLGTCFGSDLSGRQIELRPYPSKSALKVTASIAVTLRWLTYWLQKTSKQKIIFVCEPFFNNDGIGGHVHFGRRRPMSLAAENAALDQMFDCLCAIDCFNAHSNRLRKELTPYGKRSDCRAQKHGYEYRTWPTWLSTPAQTMLALTMAKLAVLNPSLMGRTAGLPANEKKRFIYALAKLFAIRGDKDAQIVVQMLDSLPVTAYSAKPTLGPEWGLTRQIKAACEVRLFPETIRPTVLDEDETTKAIFGTAPTSVLTPNWNPVVLPVGWYVVSHTSLKTSEITIGLISKMPISVGLTTSNRAHIWVGSQIAAFFKAKCPTWKTTYFPQYKVMDSENANDILFNTGVFINPREILLKYFPVIKLSQLQEQRKKQEPEFKVLAELGAVDV